MENPRDLEPQLHPVEVLGLFWALLRNPAPLPYGQCLHSVQERWLPRQQAF